MTSRQDVELAPIGDERDHDLGLAPALPVLLADRDRRLEDGARLHLGDLGIADGEPAATEAEHRIELGQLAIRAPAAFPSGIAELVGDAGDLSARGGQELVQRRIEQADR